MAEPVDVIRNARNTRDLAAMSRARGYFEVADELLALLDENAALVAERDKWQKLAESVSRASDIAERERDTALHALRDIAEAENMDYAKALRDHAAKALAALGGAGVATGDTQK